MCQIERIEEMDCRDFFTRAVEQLLFSIQHPLQFTVIFLKKRFNLFKFQHSRRRKKRQTVTDCSKNVKRGSPGLQAGDVVKIRSREEILQTLDENNSLEGCYFMDEMWQYCGTQQRVLKRVNYFYDEGNFKMRKARNTVLLEGLHCSGKISNYKQKCDRHCLFFWREEWLDKIR